jgi:acyl-CoA reductase-like NAD-dependent aldehyde dehydrogenase
MKIGILSRRANLYSTRRLVEAAKARGHQVRVVDTLRCIWTENTGRAMRMARHVEAGMLWVNSENNRNLPSPFGGIKMSGIGRDGGDWSFDFYMETKNVCIAHGTHKVPQLGKG